ncbi:uncharacterized protein EV420DRAFT_1244913, partial [Desarmillaria tabescens]
GPAIPHWDRKDLYPRYCRLMLLLFKPWVSAGDLHDVGQTWETAFSEFIKMAGPEVLKVINNMQIMHECKDSRDD